MLTFTERVFLKQAERRMKLTLTPTDIRKRKYTDCIYDYGFLTLTALLKEYEAEQNFEECCIIRDALIEHNEALKDHIPTNYEGALKYLNDNINTEVGVIISKREMKNIGIYMKAVKDYLQ